MFVVPFVAQDAMDEFVAFVASAFGREIPSSVPDVSVSGGGGFRWAGWGCRRTSQPDASVSNSSLSGMACNKQSPTGDAFSQTSLSLAICSGVAPGA